MSGDMIWTTSPSTAATTAVAANAGSTRNVNISLTNANGDVHEWANMSLTSGVTVTDDNANGECVSSIVGGTTLTLVNGTATVVIDLTVSAGNNWAAADAITVDVASATILGYAVAQDATASVDTLA